ncbi:putative alcohol dehydrogenase [Cutibacterium modestum 31N]|nr:putative alcohol dehydrogenase [Cutibacterium modestum 31N]
MTAYGAAHHGADLRYGESVVVVGTGERVRTPSFARAMSADLVIAIDVQGEKLAEAKRLGATHIVNSVTDDA